MQLPKDETSYPHCEGMGGVCDPCPEVQGFGEVQVQGFGDAALKVQESVVAALIEHRVQGSCLQIARGRGGLLASLGKSKFLKLGEVHVHRGFFLYMEEGALFT